MASSKLMASRNPDLNRKLSACSSTTDFLSLNFGPGSAQVDRSPTNPVQGETGSADEEGSGTLLNAEITLLDAAGEVTRFSDESEADPDPDPDPDRPQVNKKTVEDVWREIVAGKKSKSVVQPKEEMMTLEDFLVQAGAVDETVGPGGAGPSLEVKEEKIYSYASSGAVGMGMASGVGLGSGMVDVGGGFGDGRGRGKRSLSLIEPLDKAAQQRQRRMIKNRESAARSRERKQAYQVELESMAVRLEEENERLQKENAEWMKKRFKQLMENVIPVVEGRGPSRMLKRVQSTKW